VAGNQDSMATGEPKMERPTGPARDWEPWPELIEMCRKSMSFRSRGFKALDSSSFMITLVVTSW